MKRGLGGIRDIEFAVQLLALVHGGDDPTLRARSTLALLEQLADGGYVAGDDAQALADAYVALRRAEHHLQFVDLRPAHVLPSDPEALDRLARSLGDRRPSASPSGCGPTAPWPGPCTSGCGSGRCSAPSPRRRRSGPCAAFGFADADRTREGVAELTQGLTRSSRLMRQLLPLVLDWLSRTPDPDLGLLGAAAAGRRHRPGCAKTLLSERPARIPCAWCASV